MNKLIMFASLISLSVGCVGDNLEDVNELDAGQQFADVDDDRFIKFEELYSGQLSQTSTNLGTVRFILDEQKDVMMSFYVGGSLKGECDLNLVHDNVYEWCTRSSTDFVDCEYATVQGAGNHKVDVWLTCDSPQVGSYVKRSHVLITDISK